MTQSFRNMCMVANDHMLTVGEMPGRTAASNCALTVLVTIS
jgi:hypothetical protein